MNADAASQLRVFRLLQLFVPECRPGRRQSRVGAAAFSQERGSHANFHHFVPAGEGQFHQRLFVNRQ